MRDLIFVYGTLKEGFRNFHVNEGVRVPGEFETVERFPLYLVGPRRLPWLVDRPGEGHHVAGELYEVDLGALARMDALEQTTEPGWYARCDVDVRIRRPKSGSDGGSHLAAQVYFGSRERLETDTVYDGPIAEYTPEHAQGTVDDQAEVSPDSNPSVKMAPPGLGKSAT